MKKEREIIGRTTKCLICLNEAKIHSGNVIKGEDSVIAGWCSPEHSEVYLKHHSGKGDIKYLMNETGCYGAWHEAYGFNPEP